MNSELAMPKEKLLPHVGSMEQLAPVQRVCYLEGKAKSVEAIQIETGSGLAFTLLVDRALDLASVRFCGRSLCWRSSAGIVAPAHYERKGAGWLRGFGGGMLATCGLRNVGEASEESWETYGLHGEVSYLPAAQVATSCAWEGETYRIQVSGQVREAYPFGPNLKLQRTWKTELGAHWIELEDRVTNEGYRPEIQMQLYHWNFGFPLLNEKSRLYLTTDHVVPRDDTAAQGVAEWRNFLPPTPDFKEQVYFHSYQGDPPEESRAMIVSDRDDPAFAVELSHATKELPYFWQWKMCGMGDYVLGVEPTNCLAGGRARWLETRQPGPLMPGESRIFHLRLSVLPTREAVAAAMQRYPE